jgi:ferritin-like protein
VTRNAAACTLVKRMSDCGTMLPRHFRQCASCSPCQRSQLSSDRAYHKLYATSASLAKVIVVTKCIRC